MLNVTFRKWPLITYPVTYGRDLLTVGYPVLALHTTCLSTSKRVNLPEKIIVFSLHSD